MEQKKEYLTEENYEKTKKKLLKIVYGILLIGLLLGGTLIIGGVIKKDKVNKINEERYQEAYKRHEKEVKDAQKRLKEIETEKEELNDIIAKKEYKCDSLNMMAPNWYADKNKCENEISQLKSKKTELESEEFTLNAKLEKSDFEEKHLGDNIFYLKKPSITYIIYYYLGFLVILGACMISLIIYLITKRREIRMFGIQQTMPVTQEAISKMSPTIGDAAQTVGKGIAQGVTKGVKEGLKDNNKNVSKKK